MTQRLADQRGFHFPAGGVGAVQNTAMAVAAFSRQVVTHFTAGLRIGIKRHAMIDQPLHAVPRIAGDK